QATSGTRYRLHDLVRLYATHRARAHGDGIDPDTTRRLYDWYLYTATAATDLIAPRRRQLPLPPSPRPAAPVPPFADRAAAVAWLDSERRHLMSAIHNAIAVGRHEHAWRLAYVLYPYFNLYRHSLDWLSVAEAG